MNIEERYENTGFVYFSEDGRVFWAYDPATDEITLRQGWGYPTETQTAAIMDALAQHLLAKSRVGAK